TSEERKGEVFPVAAYRDAEVIGSLDNDNEPSLAMAVTAASGNGFFSLDDDMTAAAAQNTIEAVIHETQTLTSGSTVKLRLLNDVYINGKRIPKDNFVFGTASLNGERLEITIDHIRDGASLFPVSLNVHDMDG